MSRETPYDHLSRDELLTLLERRDAERTFGLVWERDAARHEETLRGEVVTLEPVEELGVGGEPHRNLIIEGDNFDALRSLRLTHRGQVKCIYIDPPYNTGGQEVTYHDRFGQREHRFEHSAWLEFMYRRLHLARDLLREDGVLLVSIDDNEVAPLTLMLDGLFPGGRVATFVWRRRNGSNAVPDTFVTVDHEYVLCYARPGFSFAGTAKALDDYREFDPGNPDPWKNGDLSKPHTYRQRPNGFYAVHDPAEDVWYPPNPARVWAFASAGQTRPGQKLRRQTMEQLVAEGRVVFPRRQPPAVYPSAAALREAIRAGHAPRFLRLGLFDTPEEEEEYLAFYVGKRVGFGTLGYKRFRSEMRTTSKPVSTWIAGLREAANEEGATILRSGLNADGTALLGQMLQGTGAEFSYPKPLSLLQSLLRQATGPGDLVLDFFAGSGTTAHAVLALNAEQQAEPERRFMLVSSTEAGPGAPERNVCRDVTRERVARAIAGYTARSRSGQVAVTGLGGEFAYLRTRRVAASRLREETGDTQVWTTLQLLHTGELGLFCPDTPVQRLQAEHLLLLYLTRVDGDVLTEVRALAGGTALPVWVYTWEPEAVRPHLPEGRVRTGGVAEVLRPFQDGEAI
ncbi:site-specific DNA-methyltransferase [Deinococcus hopiensis]|uniref:Adenine-specific DNA-methyltransferase n=1 Tax=Deinococcus hopiensis KR-140 TaxID=695939 RepID=A0A1W1UGA7_9DEIO|nr:DNA methyltransferase [Deinococcus hopiensis]SMB80135.1 adenine-specific DNA-methyltransferase [Deinococcus hopiensis KR-140]